MGKIVRSAQLSTTLINVQRKFLTDFRAADAVAGWRHLATVMPSKTKTEELAWFGKSPKMKDVTNDVVEIGGASSYDYSLTSTTRQAGMSFSREWWEDDQLNFGAPLIASMSEEVTRYRGQEVFNLFTGTGLAFDGTAFFDDTRTQGDSGAIDNQLTVTNVSATTLTIDEVHFTIQSAMSHMMAFADDKGSVLGRGPDTIIVPPSLYTDFWQALNTVAQQGSQPALPPIAPGTAMKVGPWTLMVNHVTSSASVVYFARTTGVVKPFVFVERHSPIIEGITSTNGREWLIDREIPYIATDRFATGYGDPRDMIEVTLAAA